MLIGAYLFSLIAGILSVTAAYRIYRKTSLSYLGEYLILIILSNIWGFVIWTLPSLISGLTDSSLESADRFIILSIIKWFAFPVHVFHAWLLLTFLNRLTENSVTGRLKNTYFITSSIAVVSVLGLLIQNPLSELFRYVSILLTYSFILMEMIILIYFTLRNRNENEPLNRLVYRFSGSGLLFYILYLGISSGFSVLKITGLKSSLMLNLSAYCATFFVPLLFVYSHFIKDQKYMQKKRITDDDLKSVLKAHKLPPREEEIVILIFRGLSNKEIEDKLFISHQTVKNYISGIYRKLGVKSRLDLMNFIRSTVEYM